MKKTRKIICNPDLQLLTILKLPVDRPMFTILITGNLRREQPLPNKNPNRKIMRNQKRGKAELTINVVVFIEKYLRSPRLQRGDFYVPEQEISFLINKIFTNNSLYTDGVY